MVAKQGLIMGNPFDTLITADIFNQPKLGKGSNGTVYQHPTNTSLVVKVPNNGGVYPETLSPTPVNNPHIGRGFGVPIAKQQVGGTTVGDTFFPKDVEIQPKIEGKPVPYWYGTKTTDLERISHLNKLRKLPQEAFNQQRADIKYLADNGYNFDPKPSNTLVDSKNGRLNIVDAPIEPSKNPQPWSTQREWIEPNLQIPQDSPIRESMTPRQKSAATTMWNQIRGKLNLAKTALPMLGTLSTIIDAPRQGQISKDVYTNKISPMEGWAKWFDIPYETYDIKKDFI